MGGLLLACGHYRNGILLAPATAAAMAELVLEGRTSELIAHFAPARFASALRPRLAGDNGGDRCTLR